MTETNEEVRMPPTGAACLAIVMSVIMVFGTLTNFLIIVTHIRERKYLLKDGKDVLVFSLALGDFLMTSTVVPFCLVSAIAGRWVAGDWGCKWYGFITTFVGLSSIHQLALIAVERLLTLSRCEAKPMPRLRAIQLILIAWALAFISSCFPFFGWSRYTLEGYRLHCAIVWSMETSRYAWYCSYLLVIYYALPLVLIFISYGKTLRVVRRMHLNAARLWGPDSIDTRRSYVAQVRVAKQFAVVTAGYLFAWTPYAIVSTLQVFFNIYLPLGYYEIPPILSKTANIYNPIIYFFMYDRLRSYASKTAKDIANKLC